MDDTIARKLPGAVGNTPESLTLGRGAEPAVRSGVYCKVALMIGEPVAREGLANPGAQRGLGKRWAAQGRQMLNGNFPHLPTSSAACAMGAADPCREQLAPEFADTAVDGGARDANIGTFLSVVEESSTERNGIGSELAESPIEIVAQFGLSYRVGILADPGTQPLLVGQSIYDGDVISPGQHRVQRREMPLVLFTMQNGIETLAATMEADCSETPQRPTVGVVVLHAAEQIEEQVLTGILDIEPWQVVLAADAAGGAVSSFQQRREVGVGQGRVHRVISVCVDGHTLICPRTHMGGTGVG